MKQYLEFINENKSNEKKFVVDKKNHKFQLFFDDILALESNFSLEQPDKWFDEKYVTLYELKTFEKFQRMGFAKYLLEQIFDYVKNNLNLNIITLIVDKNNYKAVNLYFNNGFKTFIEYDDSYSLIKKL